MKTLISALISATVLLSLICGSKLALADFVAAQKEFLQRSVDERAEIVSAIIASGDFNAIYDGQYSPRIQAAIEAFQTREGFPPTGLLAPNQLVLLKQRGNSFVEPLGFQRFTLPKSHMTVMVPRLLFDTEQQSGRGYAFERSDGSLSLAFEEYQSPDPPFDVLYKHLLAPKQARKITYKTLQPEYFVLSGEFRRRNFYTWVNRTPSGSTGFSLSWKGNRNAVAERAAIYITNSIKFDPGVSPPAVMEPPLPFASPDQSAPTAPDAKMTGTGF